MEASTLIIIFSASMLMWLVLVKVLLLRLEARHIMKFKTMGEPGLFLNNSVGAVFATLKFVFLREHSELFDSTLSRLSDGMIGFSIAFFLLFIFWLVVFF